MSIPRRRWREVLHGAAIPFAGAFVFASLAWGAPRVAAHAPLSPGLLGLGPVYSPTQLRAALHDNPAGWPDRIVLVRARLAGQVRFSDTLDRMVVVTPLTFTDPDGRTAGFTLPLAAGAPNPVLVRLRQLPLIGSLLPAPQTLRWGMIATYRIEVRAASCASRRATTCYGMWLADAATAWS